MARKPSYEELIQRVKELERELLHLKTAKSIGKLEEETVEREQAQKALRQTEERYRVLFDSGYDSIMVYRPELNGGSGKYIEANAIACKTSCYTREELLKLSPYDLVPPEEHPNLSKAFERLFTEGQAVKEVTLVTKDGRKIPSEVIGHLFELEGKPAIMINSRDISERKHAQEALRKSEEKFRTFMETASDLMNIGDKDGNLIYVNESMARSLGYSKEEIIGMHITELLPDKDMKTAFSKNWEDLKDKGQLNAEPTILTKDGKKIYGELKLVATYDSNGEFDSAHGVFRDITERKRAEEEKKRLEAELQQAQKMEAIGTLAGGVAHDLNNVLSGIVSYPDLLLMQIPENSPLRKLLLTMQTSGKKAAAIVQDLLALARRGVVTKEVINLNDVVSEYLKSPEHKNIVAYHPEVRIEKSIVSNLMNISGSPVHLSKAIMNLVSNAAEAMPNGGLINISIENRYIDRPITGFEKIKEGNYVSFRISDSGTGISSGDMERIFDPFYTKKKMGRSGTGLGMAVVWGTVKDHKGYIDIQSTEGKGTAFTLYFPAVQKDLTQKKSPLSIKDYIGKKESVLVIDDVKEQQDIALTMLATLNYKANAVSNCKEAVQYIKKHHVDIIILDMIMDPHQDGLDTYKKILELHPVQKAIIVSGFSKTARVEEAQSLGAGKYIKKPYTLENLGLALKDELEK